MSDWRDDGACRGKDPELFFPVGVTGPAAKQIARAKRVCQGCVVRRRCLAWALDTGQQGVWGGTTDAERRAVRRALAERAANRS